MREDEAGKRNRQRKYMRERKVRKNREQRENLTHLYLRPKERKGRRRREEPSFFRRREKYYVSRIRSKARDRETKGTGLSYEERR